MTRSTAEEVTPMRNCSQRVSIFSALIGMTSIATSSFISSDALANRQEEIKESETHTVTETKVLKSDTVCEFSRSVGLGRMVKFSDGKDGSITRVFKLISKDGKQVKELIREERIDAKPTIIHLGKGGYSPSRGSFSRTKTLTMRASAYDPGPQSNGKWAGTTALGIRPTYGIVAVDPRTIPLGSLLFVEGYGFAYAADTGGAIKRDRIDLCMNTIAECNRFGRRTVKVHVLKSK
jgi:3D (Asp-Asp-Asp) domain-containing protein